jgi:hypothetical protein
MKKLIGQTDKQSRDIISTYCFGVRAKNARIEKSDIGIDANSDILPVHDSQECGRGESVGSKEGCGVGAIRVVNGIYLPLGFPFFRGGK